MKKITLIHTVKSVLESFEEALTKECKEKLSVSNIYDSFLADDPDELGYVSTACKRKLYRDVISALENKPDIIAVTCSAMTETVKQIRPFVDVPLIAIDENMIAEAVKNYTRIRVLATAVSSAVTTKETLLTEAEKLGRHIEVTATDNMDAFNALQGGDKEHHDMLVKEQAKGVKDFEVIVLAQASMAHLEKDIAQITGLRVLTSPSLCISEINRVLDGMPPVKTAANAIEHVAVYVENIEWYVNFFETVFGMKVRETDEEDGVVRQVWMNQGIQLIQKDGKADEGALGHIAVSVSNLDKVLEKAHAYTGVKEMPQGRNWLEIPGGICLEVLDE